MQGVRARTQDSTAPAESVDPLRTTILLLHPIAAMGLIWMFVRQRRWREQSSLLRGDERKQALADHEITGEWVVRATIGVIGLAFAAQIARASIEGAEWNEYIVPDHFHGWVGFLGLFLMLILRKYGRTTRTLKESGMSFARSKQTHGMISDVMLLLITIHGFLGFLYLLKIL
tara:strand:+ start:3707 stop:4225 length:519 start_codon:yes stop_codon:yes gene_type:complete